MELYINNIGKLQDTRIELNGITVIAGENNTGKSTIGRTLYSIYNGLYDIDNKCRNEKYGYILNKIISFLDIHSAKFAKEYSSVSLKEHDIFDLFKPNEINEMGIVDKIGFYLAIRYKDLDRTELSKFCNALSKVISKNSTGYRSFILVNEFNREFNGQYINVNKENAKIILKENGRKYIFSVFKDGIASFGKFISKVIPLYLDTPFAVDDKSLRIAFRRIENHHKTLEDSFTVTSKLTSYEKYTLNNEYKNIKTKLLKVTNGFFKEDDLNISFQEKGMNEAINFKNLSAGLKSLTIIQRLMDNYALKENGIIIMDEPEIHLHPKWQLLLAELIVLLHKELNMTILITTHSPYFLNAIEVYSAKYSLADKVKYYLTHLGEDKVSAYVDDVTANLERVYSLLYSPMEDLEEIEYRIGNYDIE